MFDIGFGEIFLIAVVALLVLGPERLPKAARFAGLWVRRARAQWYSVKAELENELADEDLKRSLKQTHAELMDARDSLAQGGAALKKQFEETGTDVHDTLRGAVTGAAATTRDASDEDVEPPLSSVADALEEPEVPIDDHFPAPGDTAETAHSAGPGHDARR
jgi:sec-independent protein translocase protein TatB